MLEEFPDTVDREALDEYERSHGAHRFGPVVVVIAAYDEQDAIGGVLRQLPEQCCGLPVEPLVVVDGATDATAEVARSCGAQVCVAPVNRGQGAALRLGYHIAATRGAQYVVTTDADGQYDQAEIATLLRPLIADEADFVTGSRRLGRNERPALLRRIGTHVFAGLVSLLTRTQLTDTTFGFRGMKAEVPMSVALRQEQYQASELLIGVLLRGYRVAEQPMTMRPRAAGESKKGGDLLYGVRFGRVVLATWWRESRAAGVRSSASRTPSAAHGDRGTRDGR
ncbi:hypothetical protein GCM10027174_28810 [Salinifilum aidingensis]